MAEGVSNVPTPASPPLPHVPRSESTGTSNNNSRNGRSQLARRWLHFLIFTLLLIGGWGLLLGLRGRVTELTRSHFDSLHIWARHVANIFACAVAVNLLTRLLKPSFGHLNENAIRHPPTWCAVLLSVGVVAVLDLGGLIGPSGYEGCWWEWTLYAIISCGVVGLLHWSGRVESKPKTEEADTCDRTLEQIVENPTIFRAWYEREGHATEDLLGTKPVARRLAGYLSGGLDLPRTVGLVGGFGSGKSSIVQWLQKELENRVGSGIKVWACEVKCWGFEDSSSAAEHILKRAVAEVELRLDCFSFRSLPETYRKTFSAGGDWVRNLSDILFGAADPYEQFERLSRLLASVPARLVIIVEDIDRNKSARFDPGEILALLSRLREYPALSFVLTGSAGIDFAKLCERVQYVPSISVDRALRVISAFREQKQSEFPDDLAPFGAGEENPWSPSNHLLHSVYGINSQARALCRLLSTPRDLKLVVRHAHHAWQSLHGEVSFDHLLAITALQHAAGPALTFLLSYRDQLFDNPADWSARDERLAAARERLRTAWAAATTGATWDVEGALDLLLFMIPHAGDYLGERQPRSATVSQGVGQRNYLERIIAENVGQDVVRDQEILRAMRDWALAPVPNADLVTRLRTCPEFVEAWEYFESLDQRRDGSRILCLAGHYLSTLGNHDTREGSHEPPPGFIALWRIAHRKVDRDEGSYQWLESQVIEALRKSLPLAISLYYYWASHRYGILRAEDIPRLRDAIYQQTRTQFTSGRALLDVVHLNQPYELYQLVFPPGDESGFVSPHRGIEHWTWLGPILYEALVADSRLMAPKLAGLISEQRSGEIPGETFARTSRERLLALFPSNSEAVVRILSEERDRAGGNERHVLQQVVESTRA